MKTILAYLFLAVVSLSNTLSAHEYWIEPLEFEININQKLKAHEKVGSNFKGNEYAYLDTSYKSFNITVDDNTQPIKSRLGDLPAVNEIVEKEGLVILSAETTDSDLVYDTSEKFQKFLKNQGLEWVKKRHSQRGLPEKGFKEIYRRYPKSLIKVGHGKGKDKAFGLPLEIVLDTNPYSDSNGAIDAIKARLLWKGKPLASKRVNVFNRVFKGDNRMIVDSTLKETNLVTDVNGSINIPRAEGGIFLISAVHMIEPLAVTIQETNAVWESLWASITYEVLKPN